MAHGGVERSGRRQGSGNAGADVVLKIGEGHRGTL